MSNLEALRKPFRNDKLFVHIWHDQDVTARPWLTQDNIPSVSMCESVVRKYMCACARRHAVHQKATFPYVNKSIKKYTILVI